MRVCSPANAGFARQVCRAQSSYVIHSHDLGGPQVQIVHQAKPVVPRDRFIDLKELELLCCVKKSTIYQMLKDKNSDFPRPVHLSARMVRWSEVAALQWIQNRLAASSNDQAAR